MTGDSEEKNAASSDGIGVQVCRKKPAGSSARERAKSFQSESASSKAKNNSESSDSENGPTRQETPSVNQPSPTKAKLAGKSGIRKRNSKRVAQRVLSCMQKRQKKMMASDSVINDGLCSSDMRLRSNSRKENEDSGSSSHKNVKPSAAGRSSRNESPIKDSHRVSQTEVPGISKNKSTSELPVSSSEDKKEECVEENTYKTKANDEKSWKTFEMALFEKGLEIFGHNRLVERFLVMFFQVSFFSLYGIIRCFCNVIIQVY